MDGVRMEDIRGTVHVLQMKPDCGGRVQRKESKCLGRGMLRLERAGRRPGGREKRALVNAVREDLKSSGVRGEDAEHLRIEGID